MPGIALVSVTPCDEAAQPLGSWTRTANAGPLGEAVPAAGLAESCRPGRGVLHVEETGIPMAIAGRLLPGAATHCHLTAAWWMAGTNLLHVISEKS